MKRLLLSSIALLAICGSLRAQTYTFTQSTAGYQNLVNPTSLSNGELWDEDNFTLPLAFPFIYNGHGYDQIRVNPNGYLEFRGDSVIFSALLADLVDRGVDVSESPISYTVEGTTGNRIEKIEFRNAGFYNGAATDSINFQIWLYENDYAIEVHVGSGNVTDVASDFDFGGPVVGVVAMTMNFDPIYTLVLSGDAAAAVAGTWDGQNDPPALNGTPVSGTVYRFAQNPGNCGWLAAIHPADAVLCPNSNGTLAIIPTGGSYQWYRDDVLIPGATDTALAVSEADTAARFTVAVTYNGCSDTALAAGVVALTVNGDLMQFSDGTVDANGTVHICIGDEVFAQVDYSGSVAVQWYRDGQLLPGETTAYTVITESGSYAAVAVSADCPDVADTALLNVVVHQPLTFAVQLSNDSLFAGVAADTYQWQLDGVDIPDATNPYFVPGAEGNYTVVVTVGNGCQSTSDTYVYTGLTERTEQRIAVYPNPTDRELLLPINLPQMTYDIVNATGALVASGNARHAINVSALPSGIYLIRLEGANLRYKQTFVKQ